jgi:hypothetical protein
MQRDDGFSKRRRTAMTSAEALRIMRQRMEAISKTASVEGLLNYGSLVVQPAPVKELATAR